MSGIGDWRPSKAQWIGALTVVIALCGALASATDLGLPKWIIALCGVIGTVAAVVLRVLTNVTVDEANQQITRAYYTPSPQQQLDRINVPEPPQ